MKKKVVAACMTVALAAVAFGGATLAYFTDTEDVPNTFTVGKVDIALTEPSWDIANANIVPGRDIPKDPTVTVETGSEDCYVRMIVTVDNLAALKNAFPSAVEDGKLYLQNLVDGWNSSTWECVSITEDATNDTAKYEFRYFKEVTEPGELPALFTKVVIPKESTSTELKNIENKKINVHVYAHAIQSEGFGSAAAAWDAFDDVDANHYD